MYLILKSERLLKTISDDLRVASTTAISPWPCVPPFCAIVCVPPGRITSWAATLLWPCVPIDSNMFADRNVARFLNPYGYSKPMLRIHVDYHMDAKNLTCESGTFGLCTLLACGASQMSPTVKPRYDGKFGNFLQNMGASSRKLQRGVRQLVAVIKSEENRNI